MTETQEPHGSRLLWLPPQITRGRVSQAVIQAADWLHHVARGVVLAGTVGTGQVKQAVSQAADWLLPTERTYIRTYVIPVRTYSTDLRGGVTSCTCHYNFRDSRMVVYRLVGRDMRAAGGERVMLFRCIYI